MLVCSSIIGCKFHFPSVPRFLSLRYCFNPALTREKKIADPLNNQSELCKCVIAFSDCLVILNGRTLLWDSNRSISSLSVPNYKKKNTQTHNNRFAYDEIACSTYANTISPKNKSPQKRYMMKIWLKRTPCCCRARICQQWRKNNTEWEIEKNNGHQKKQKE